MKTKLNKASAILLLGLVIILLLSFAVSSLPTTITVANAWTSSGGYTGKEDPEDIDDFDDNMQAMYKYRAWCVFKGLGMDDNQATAALACMQAESNYRPECVEGHYFSTNTHAEAVNYLQTYSQYMDTDPDTRTEFTDAILLDYGVSQSAIDQCHDGNASSADGTVGPGHSFGSVSLTTYYDSAGVGWLGCGLYQFTGAGNFGALCDWAGQHGERWFNFEQQLSFFLADPTIGGYSGAANGDIYEWVEQTKGKSLDECVESYFHTFINSNELSDMVEDRQEIALPIYEEMAGVEWNYKYAQKVLALAGLTPISVRDGIQDKSVIYSYASAVAYYPRNGGFLVDLSQRDQIKDRNSEVWTGYVKGLQGENDTSTQYSLFELYGEDVHWFRYFGEATYTPTLLDHVWSATDQNKTEDPIMSDTIEYDAYNYLSCNVYPDRPLVLTDDDIHNGDRDPRVSALSVGWFNGFFYVSGSIKLEIAKYFVAIVAILTGPEIREVFVDLVDKLEESTVWQVIKLPILGILGLAIIFFIFSIVGKAIKYAKGQGAARDAINRFIVGLICLGMLFAAVARPDVFNGTITKAVTIIDTIFSESLQSTLQTDEVVNVQDPDLAIHAALWRKAIFNPWCRGQFDNMNYEDLYTQFAAVDDEHKMPQDNEVIDTSDMTGTAFYNSAEATGDVFVPAGGNSKIRNWAAYAYSCGTIYHIDSTLTEETAEDIDADQGFIFPHYLTKTTASNPDLPADLFRIIDAQMNISPQYYANGSINNNYQHAHGLNNHFEWQSTVALFNAGLLLFLFPVILKKITSFFLLLITTFKMIYFSILEIFKPDMGVKPFFESVKKSFVDYFTSSMKLVLMITLYYIFVDKGFLELVLYILCCIVILGFNLKDVRHLYQDTKARVQRAKNRI